MTHKPLLGFGFTFSSVSCSRKPHLTLNCAVWVNTPLGGWVSQEVTELTPEGHSQRLTVKVRHRGIPSFLFWGNMIYIISAQTNKVLFLFRESVKPSCDHRNPSSYHRYCCHSSCGHPQKVRYFTFTKQKM